MAVGNKASKMAVSALFNLLVMPAAAAAVVVAAAPKKGRPADPASIFACGMASIITAIAISPTTMLLKTGTVAING